MAPLRPVRVAGNLKGAEGRPLRAETAIAEPFEPDPIRIGGGTDMQQPRTATITQRHR